MMHAHFMVASSGTVDAYNAHPTRLLGEILVHLHWMQGNIAVAIPTSVHQTWYRTFHPYR